MKKFTKLLTLLTTFLIFTSITKAGSLSLSASTNVTTGSAVRVSVKINNLAGRFKVTSSDSSILSGGAEDFWESTQTVTFTAKKAGRATITVTPLDVADFDTNGAFTSTRSITITVSGGKNNTKNNTIDINKTYSSNNYLSSLSVEGHALSPEFNKEKTSYSLDLDSSVKTIMVSAKAEDSNANIKGTGEITLSEGKNVINITVVAENGNEKVYTINANVEDKNPINVKINKKNYTVVKNIDSLKMPQNYEPTTIKINEQEVPGFASEITGYILVGLKDKKGNINLYIYNPANGRYKLYTEISFNSISIQYFDPESIPTGYKKYTMEIDNKKVSIYKKNKKSNYALIYGMNINNGDIGWYKYDIKDNTLQRFSDEEVSALSVLNNKYLITIIILSVSNLMLMLFILILMIKIRKENKD